MKKAKPSLESDIVSQIADIYKQHNRNTPKKTPYKKILTLPLILTLCAPLFLSQTHHDRSENNASTGPIKINDNGPEIPETFFRPYTFTPGCAHHRARDKGIFSANEDTKSQV